LFRDIAFTLNGKNLFEIQISLMNGSGNIEEDDAAPFHLCVVCLSKFNYSIGCNLLERYEEMRKFFEENEIEEFKWIQLRIDFIKNKRKREQEIIEIDE
jgi:hypothetical protein